MTKKQNNLRLNVGGLDCQSCAIRIEDRVRKLKGVDDVSVSFLDGMLTARGDDISSLAVVETVKSLGFTAEEMPVIEARYDDQMNNLIAGSNFKAVEITEIGISALLVALSGFGAYLNLPGAVQLGLVLSAIAVSGRSIARKGISSVFKLQLDINFLMFAAVIGALIIGEWLEGGVIIVLFAASELLENASVKRSKQAIESLVKLAPRVALVIDSGHEEVRPVEMIARGSKILVKPGAMIPLDGQVSAGFSSVNQASITGEALPVSISPGMAVLAGSINGEGALEVQVTKASGDTTLDRIIRLVQQAQAQRAPVQTFVERFAKYYTPLVVFAAVLVAVVPPLLNGAWSTWIYRALALLVISCPCALVISTPVTIVSALACAARKGVLIKGGTFLENLHKVRTIAFDKTGTITEGVLEVREIHLLNGLTTHELLSLAASVESHSEHPIAKSIIKHAFSENVKYDSPVNFKALPGLGAQALIENRIVYVGNHNLFEELKICDGSAHELLDEIENDNQTAILIGSETGILGIITVTDRVRTSAKETISELRRSGVENVYLLTGDNRQAGNIINDELNFDGVKSELLPEQKVSEIKRLQAAFGMVAMVGDGVNDAPALATADIGIAMGGAGSDAVLETADVVLMSDRIDRLPWIYRLSRKAYRIIVANIAFAILVKLLFIILAVAGQATLWMAVFADTGITLLVIFNGMRALRCS